MLVQRKSVDDRDTLTRYSSEYETQLDPFTAFSAQASLPFFSSLFLLSFPLPTSLSHLCTHTA